LDGNPARNTAIFSLVSDFPLRSLAVSRPGELVLFRLTEGVRRRLSRAGGTTRI